MKWYKLGRIFCTDNNYGWMCSHAMIPIAERMDGELYRIYFSPRDKYNRGHGAYLEIDMRNPLKVLRVHNKPVLEPGELGCFDDSGILLNSIVNINGRKHMYYVGINLGVTVKFRTAVGLAQWNEESDKFERCFKGPILDRTKEMPHLAAAPEVMFDGTKFRMWFTGGKSWKIEAGEVKHYYNIEYAESENGIDWKRDGVIAMDFRDKYEYAMGGARVLCDGALWRMWFCARATADNPHYRICYAESSDGVVWQRKDEQVGISVSPEGWDSQMMCYPFVFDHDGKRYMLYGGNDYSRSGFGIAVLEG